MDFVIDSVLQENTGQYVCDAINGFGGQRNELTIKVLSAPRVVILHNQSSFVEDSRETLECIVENKGGDEKCWITWIVDGKQETNVRNTSFQNS